MAGEIECQGVDRDKGGGHYCKIVRLLECRAVFTPVNWLEIDEHVLSSLGQLSSQGKDEAQTTVVGMQGEEREKDGCETFGNMG